MFLLLDGKLTGYGIAVVVIGSLIILIVIVAVLVFCCYRRRHRKSTVHLDNYFSNITYENSKTEQKPEKVENIYQPLHALGAVKVSENVTNEKLEKEKEVLEHVISNV